MRIIAEKESVSYCKGDQPTVGQFSYSSRKARRVEVHTMAQITLDLEPGGQTLWRGDKGDHETRKKERRQSRRRRPGEANVWVEEVVW